MLRPIKIFLLGGLTVFPLIGVGSAHGYEYSIRHAFCSDYANARSNIISSTFQYDRQKAYNSCMSDANRLIRNHEAQQERERERERKRARRNSERYERQRATEEKRRKEEEKRRKEEEQRILQFESQMEDYFR